MDLWKSVTSMFGEQYVVLHGALLMPKLHADTLDFRLLELLILMYMLFLMTIKLAGWDILDVLELRAVYLSVILNPMKSAVMAPDMLE